MRRRIIFTVAIILVVALIVALVAMLFSGEQESDEMDEDSAYEAAIAAMHPTSYTDITWYDNMVAWLTIPDTAIDFPIMQGEDNDYYLSHSYTGEYYGRGCPFLDYRNTPDFTDFNSIIYGHNIRNQFIFAPLLDFRDTSYLQEHNTGILYTKTGEYTIDFLACAVVDNRSIFYNVIFPSEDGRLEWLTTLRTTAVASQDFLPFDYVDAHLLTLSTCSDDYDTARTILVGAIRN